MSERPPSSCFLCCQWRPRPSLRATAGASPALGLEGCFEGDGGLVGDGTSRGVGLLPGRLHAHQRDGVGVSADRLYDTEELAGAEAEQQRPGGDSDVGAGEHLLVGEAPGRAEQVSGQGGQLGLGEHRRPVSAPPCRRLLDALEEAVGAVAGGGKLGEPTRHEVSRRGMALGFAGAPGRHLAGLVGVVALVLDGGGDLRRALGEQLAGPLGHAGDAPVAEPSRRPVVGLDGVAELDRLGRRRHPAERRGGVQDVAQGRRVERFPASFVVGNAAKVGDQNVVVGLRVTGPGGGVAGARPDQAVGRDTGLGAPPAPAAGDHPGVQVGQSGLGLGVQNGVHVLGPADQTEQRDRLVGGHHELHPGPFRVHQTRPIGRVAGAAGTEYCVVLRLGYRTGEAQVSALQSRPKPEASRLWRRNNRGPHRGGRRPVRAPFPGGNLRTQRPSFASKP